MFHSQSRSFLRNESFCKHHFETNIVCTALTLRIATAIDFKPAFHYPSTAMKLTLPSASALLALSMSLSSLLLGQVATPMDATAEFSATKSQFEKQTIQLDGAKSTASKAVAARYLTALDASEKSATAGSKLNAVTAILAEKQAVQSDAGLPPAASPDLPKELGAARAAYIRDIAQISKAMAPKNQALAISYLRALVAIEAKARAGKNEPLLAEIAGEKQKAAAAGTAANASASAATPPANSKNLVINGDFSKAESDGQPTAWESKGNAKVVVEGGQSFVRLSDRGCKQSFPVPKGAKSFTFNGRVRSDDFVATPTGNLKGMSISIMGKGETYKGDWITNVTVRGPSKAWKKLGDTKGIPPGVTEIELHLTRWDCLSANIDYDDIELSFK